MSKSRKRKKRRQRRILLAILAALIVVLAAVLVLSSNREIVITLNGDSTVETGYGKEYTDEGAEAIWRSKLLKFISGHIDVSADTSGVDTGKLGSYQVIYTAEYNNLTGTAVRNVNVIDDEAPEIKLTSIDDYYTLPGQTYVEEGYSAIDNCDGDVTANVKAEEKDGVVYYTVTDAAGNKATAERTIVYDDRDAPEITFASEDTIITGSEWTDSYTAIDNVDGDITDKVKVEGSVDTSTAGTYTLKYTVEDSYGNKAEVTRDITVIDKASGQTVDPVSGSKIVFLTFDDGPGQYTERLLDILAKYNVKVTFFVTNQFPAYQYLITREAEEGHTVAVHTYSHQYAQIYSSTSAYWADFEAMNDIIEERTGSRTDIFRFPGGSSNMVSANYTSGIMTELTDQAIARGLDYYDWNVSSGDAGETTDSSQVAANVIAGMESMDVSVVLMHDIHEYTVDAIEEIIQYGLANGYTFMSIEKGIYKCHHGVNN